MSKIQLLRSFVNQRLNAAAEEIFDLFERTIVEYEEQLNLLDSCQKHDVDLHVSDVQQLVVSQDEVSPEQQELSPRLDQNDPPNSPQIKDERKELWGRQEGELQGEEEFGISMLRFKRIPVKREEEDGEKLQSSQLHENQTVESRDTEHLKMEADGEDCGGPEPDLNPDNHLQPVTPDKTSHFSGSDTDDSGDWEESDDPQEDFKMLMVKKEEVPSEQQERSNEDPREPPHIKEEQEELWSSQEGEQLQGPEEADISMVTFFPVPVKTEEDDGEKPQSLQLLENQTEESRDIEHLKTETDGEDCGGSEPDRDFNPDYHLQPVSPDKTSHFSGSDTDDSGDWEEREEPQEGLNPLQNKDLPVSDMNCNTGSTSVSFSECGTSFGRKEQLQKNKEIHTGEKPFSCSVCGKTYTKKINLHQHMLRHSVEKPFSCSVCKRSFIWRGEMMTHMRIHTGEKPFSCSVCGKTFSRQGCLRTHSLVHTEEKPFGCLVCGKRFVRSGDFKRHSVVHTGEKPFSCSVCGKCFSRHALLRQHSFVHTEEKRFSCSVCGKGFTESGALKYHSVVHTREKPFSCSVCGKPFFLREQLRLHYFDHTGETPFSCSVCGKRFAKHGSLKKHSTIHTEEKPFGCSVCGKRFVQQGNLRRHSVIHTGEKPFSCSVCERKFTRHDHVKKHKCVG
ncbi:zinc finger protein 260-like isoform X2 [Labrus mixtus]|uniref:zinc finger protein 260-like isoform X2 n=1 Tax=Labrus mixtus TaxID=508554 RepID=UPI0029C04F9B|nr:zinc finger protein 260-like isoform X2 [Labrus mixtus]